jgi:hypothetical protein
VLEIAKLPVDYFLCDGRLEHQVPNWLFALRFPHVPKRLTPLRFPFALKGTPSTRRFNPQLPLFAADQSLEVARTTRIQAQAEQFPLSPNGGYPMLAFGIVCQTVPSSDIEMVPNVAKSEKRTDRFQEFHRVVRTTET